MKDSAVFALFGGGGFGVIISYLFLYLFNILSPLAKIFPTKIWWFWVFSMIITAASVVGVMVWFSFYERLEEYRDLFLISLAVFLAFAMLWSLNVANIVKNKLNPSRQVPFLIIVALATIGLLIATVYTTDKWLVIIAAAIIVFHHLFLDAFMWSILHQKKYNMGRKLKIK